ncbi:MAG: hypothetical protein IKL84_02270 [Clostridia bacterium]|nr:hypothetical protein [Clostridia bacterium]
MKHFLLSIALVLTALLILCACAPADTPDDPSTDTTDGVEQTNPPETEKLTTADRLTDRYDSRLNTYVPVSGTFTDRIDATILMQLMTMSQSADAAPMLYNIVSLLNLTRDDVVLYSEMSGDKMTLEAELIDGLFMQGEAMNEALRGEFTIMAGGRPYTVFDLAKLSADELAALNIPQADLVAFLETIPAAANYTGETLSDEVRALLSANGIA